jgi:hypothetical protein
MIIEVVRVDRSGKPGQVIDVVTLNDDGTLSSTTGRGLEICATKVQQFGMPRAKAILRDWGNGYVLTREQPD